MMHRPLRVCTFDVDAVSLNSLRDALPGWRITTINGATVASLTPIWNPGVADLLVLSIGQKVTESLGMCRFLAFCTSYSGDARRDVSTSPGRPIDGHYQKHRSDAPLLVLVPSGQDTVIGAALEAGAHGCLFLPIHAGEMADTLTRVLAPGTSGWHIPQPGACESGDSPGGEPDPG